MNEREIDENKLRALEESISDVEYWRELLDAPIRTQKQIIIPKKSLIFWALESCAYKIWGILTDKRGG